MGPMHVLSWALVAAAASAQHVANVRRSYDVISDQVHVINDPEFVTGEVSIENPGTVDYKMHYVIDIVQDLPEDTQIELVVVIATDNRIAMPRIKRSFCSFVQTDQVLYPGFVKNGNMSAACPIKVGHYVVRDYVIDKASLPVHLPYGRYAMNVTLFDEVHRVRIVWNGRIVKSTRQ